MAGDCVVNVSLPLSRRVMIRSVFFGERSEQRISHLSRVFRAISHSSAQRSSPSATSNGPFFTSWLYPASMKIFPLNAHCQALIKRKQ